MSERNLSRGWISATVEIVLADYGRLCHWQSSSVKLTRESCLRTFARTMPEKPKSVYELHRLQRTKEKEHKGGKQGVPAL
jgi:hypothetical protein